MAITQIKITNFKSLKNIDLDINELNCLIGKNGVGKTNILNAIKYFYDNLPNKNCPANHFDILNVYNDKLEISITFNFNDILNRINDKSDFYDKVVELIEHRATLENPIIVLTLKQYKNNQMHWNYPYHLLNIIKNTHPAYFLDARNIDLTNWHNLWYIIGDLANTNEINNVDFSYGGVFNSSEKKVFDKNIDDLHNEMEGMGIQISREHGRNRIISLYQLELGGIEFTYNEKKLDFFSDGTNAGNYIRLLSFLVYRIAQQKIKSPLVVIDEPEIGLHPRLIDQLMKRMINFSECVQFIISTHSPRIVKNMLQKSNHFYKVNRIDKYTITNKIPPFNDERARRIVTEKEASYYFSDQLLFVEGVTELELFNSDLLKDVFPNFNKVDIVSFDSDDVILNLINPNKMNLRVPYLILIDIDKTLQWKDENSRGYNNFKFKNGKIYNPIKNALNIKKESYFYRTSEYSRNIYQARGKLQQAEENLDFKFQGILNSFCDSSYIQYERLVRLINSYTLNYNIYSLHFTIEGALINPNTLKLFIDWFSQNSQPFHVQISYIQKRVCERTLLAILRSIVDGRLDNQKKYEQNQQTTCEVEMAINELHRVGKTKTSGWVTDFLNYVRKEIITNNSLKDHQTTFRDHFPELYAIINNIKYRSK